MNKLTVIVLCLWCVGCRREEAKKMTQAQSELVLLTITAAHLNASQTNWTVTVEARTNK